MTNSNEAFLSRRRWLGLASGATLGTGLLRAADAAPAQDHGARTYNVRAFGAKGDGLALDTAPVQAAIDACAQDQGGTVLVPAGVFVIGTIEMKSNVTLHLAAGATLLGSADGKQYRAAEAIPLHGDTTLEDGNVGLIYAVGARNVVIEGPGTIDGQGAQFLSPARGVAPPAGISGSRRPYHLLFHQCAQLTVRDIFLKDSAFHSVRVIQSQFVQLTGIRIHSRVNHNNDGFHFISSQYVHMSRCDVRCQDDACALFGSCQFVTVSDCSFTTRWSVFRFGGGEAENIAVTNCLIHQTYGCPIKMRCGPGSRFENIRFSNLVMRDVTGPISIGLGEQRRRSEAGEAQPRPPGVVRNISFSGIHATVAKPAPLPDAGFTSKYNPGEEFSCVTLNAMGEAWLENISFDDVHIIFPGGGTAEQGAVRDVPRVAGEYYAMGAPPSYGLFARNVRGLTLHNVRFQLAAPDARPAVVFDHVADAALNGLSVQGRPEAESALRFMAARDILLTAPRLLGQAAVFLQVEGAESAGIKIDGGDVSQAAKVLAFKDGASEQAVKI